MEEIRREIDELTTKLLSLTRLLEPEVRESFEREVCKDIREVRDQLADKMLELEIANENHRALEGGASWDYTKEGFVTTTQRKSMQ